MIDTIYFHQHCRSNAASSPNRLPVDYIMLLYSASSCPAITYSKATLPTWRAPSTLISSVSVYYAGRELLSICMLGCLFFEIQSEKVWFDEDPSL